MNAVAFDTETKGLNAWAEDEQAFLATWADADGEYCADLSDEAQVQQFLEAMKNADMLIAHNFPFDCHQVRETLGLDLLSLGVPIHDTHILSKVVYPEGNRGTGAGHGLKALSKVFLRADADGPEQAIKDMAKSIGLRTIKQKGAYYDVYRAYPEVMAEYARQDARYTFDLNSKFSADLGDLKRVYDLEMQVMPILVRAEKHGVKTDQAAVARLKAQYTDRHAEVHEYLAAELGEDALGGEGSNDALTEALLRIGVPLTRKTDSGKLATNKFALAQFEKDYPQIEALSEYRTLERFLSTYIGAVDGVDVVHTSFRQCEAWTSRMSSSRPNLQNLPKRAGKEVREVFVPREGMCFVVADYDSIEARFLAYYLNDKDYSQLIEDGHDPHAWMAANVYGGRVEDYVKGSSGEDKRETAKNVTYAICYGAGAPRVSDMTGLSRDEAKALISKVKGSLPGYYDLMKRIRTKIERLGHVNTIIGRKQVVNKEKAYVGLNAIIQGSAAEAIKLALVAVDSVVTPYGATPLLVVHDEIVVEAPIDCADEVLRVTQEAMTNALPLKPTLATSGSIAYDSYASA